MFSFSFHIRQLENDRDLEEKKGEELENGERNRSFFFLNMFSQCFFFLSIFLINRK